MPMEEQNRQITLLVTAFEPFGGEKINPTARILEQLPEELGGYRIRKLLS